MENNNNLNFMDDDTTPQITNNHSTSSTSSSSSSSSSLSKEKSKIKSSSPSNTISYINSCEELDYLWKSTEYLESEEQLKTNLQQQQQQQQQQHESIVEAPFIQRHFYLFLTLIFSLFCFFLFLIFVIFLHSERMEQYDNLPIYYLFLYLFTVSQSFLISYFLIHMLFKSNPNSMVVLSLSSVKISLIPLITSILAFVFARLILLNHMKQNEMEDTNNNNNNGDEIGLADELNLFFKLLILISMLWVGKDLTLSMVENRVIRGKYLKKVGDILFFQKC